MKKIGIDVDGCALNYVEFLFLPVLNKKLEVNIDYKNYHGWDTFNIPGLEVSKQVIWEVVKETWKDPDKFSQIPLISGYKEFYKNISKNYEIHYITTIDLNLYDARLKNLSDHGIFDKNKDFLHVSKDATEKAIHVTLSEAKFFIDDKPENIAVVKYFNKDVTTIWFNYNGYMKEYEAQLKPDFECQTWQKVMDIIG